MNQSGHGHCKAGLFHSAVPLRTHPECKNCCRARRAERGNMKLLRCQGCHGIATYRSKECQKAHWRAGHKETCNFTSNSRNNTPKVSGNPKAWADLVSFTEYHHATLINCALASYLSLKNESPDMMSDLKHILEVGLKYRDDPALPPHMKFELEDRAIVGVHDSRVPRLAALVLDACPGAVELAKREFGDKYWGAGAYLLIVNFAQGDNFAAVPSWKHFGIDQYHADAAVACKHPWG